LVHLVFKQIVKTFLLMQAVIVAGGLGTRINKDREFIPKPLYPVDNKSIIEHVLLNLKLAGIKEFIILVGFMADKIAKKLGDGSKYGINIKYVLTPFYDKTLGLSLLLVEEFIKGEFLLVMSDHLMRSDVIKKMIDYKIDKTSCALLVDKKIEDIFWLEDAAKVQLTGSIITGVSKQYHQYQAIDCGLFKCNLVIFNEIRKVKDLPDSMSQAVSVFSKKGKMHAVDIDEYKWIDVDEYNELEVARSMLSEYSSIK
jgi:1L-myo-inositol 1-phosphate cytidylyltransferase